MNLPPPIQPPASAVKRPRNGLVLGLVAAGVLVMAVTVYFLIQSIIASGITKGPDNMFGDQHLKTAVALIELHKVRYGQYPDRLKDLKYTGQWDQLALQSVDYYPNATRTAYYIEVRTGWIGKPTLDMPAEFWQGTGYSTALKPKNQ